jgi:hypothetical protein
MNTVIAAILVGARSRAMLLFWCRQRQKHRPQAGSCVGREVGA